MIATDTAPKLDYFLVGLDEVRKRLAKIDPRAYDRTRNHLNGATPWCGPS